MWKRVFKGGVGGPNETSPIINGQAMVLCLRPCTRGFSGTCNHNNFFTDTLIHATNHMSYSSVATNDLIRCVSLHRPEGTQPSPKTLTSLGSGRKIGKETPHKKFKEIETEGKRSKIRETGAEGSARFSPRIGGYTKYKLLCK